MDMIIRPRRLRENDILRRMVRQADISPDDFILPLFVAEGRGVKQPIPSMPGMCRLSADMLDNEIADARAHGVNAVLLFGVPDKKDARAFGAYACDGVVQRAIAAIKDKWDVYVITDVCLCEYTDHGHCGVIGTRGEVLNDDTLELIAMTALSHARAGADMVAPSDMMDGRVGYIRKTLDENGFIGVPIMAYSAKYASAFYGPFRDAANSAPAFGDRRSYQMDYHNAAEALKEVELDVREGADIIMVKPAMAYLDVLKSVKERSLLPVAAYQVSGEYAMLKMAVSSGILREEAVYEALVAIKRAGADLIISYFAKKAAKLLEEFK